jgi:two-component system response regulator YesN
MAGVQPEGSGRRIVLVVDDDPLVREVLGLFLSDTYQVSYACTGAEALTTLCRQPVALLILDHRLPDRTGLELLGELRSGRPSLPIVMLTGYGSEWICASAFKLGVKDYFAKPVSAVDLVSAVQRILSGKAGGPVPSSRAPDFSVQKAVGLIQQRFWDRLSLYDVASEVGMSKFWLSHRFRGAMGITFRDYLTRVRLERAKTLLEAGDVSITEVAQMVGFGDLPRLDKLFKRHTGLTPSGYRTQCRTAATGTRNPARNY